MACVCLLADFGELHSGPQVLKGCLLQLPAVTWRVCSMVRLAGTCSAQEGSPICETCVHSKLSPTVACAWAPHSPREEFDVPVNKTTGAMNTTLEQVNNLA